MERLKKLPPDRQKAVRDAIDKFMAEPALPSLKFRPLAAKPSHHIINARRGDRVILKHVEGDAYEAADVGPHDNVYRRWNR